MEHFKKEALSITFQAIRISSEHVDLNSRKGIQEGGNLSWLWDAVYLPIKPCERSQEQGKTLGLAAGYAPPRTETSYLTR